MVKYFDISEDHTASVFGVTGLMYMYAEVIKSKIHFMLYWDS